MRSHLVPHTEGALPAKTSKLKETFAYSSDKYGTENPSKMEREAAVGKNEKR